MQRLVLVSFALSMASLPLQAQELLLADRFGDRVLRLNGSTGAVLNGSFIVDAGPTGAYDFQRPREVLQLPPFLYVLDNEADAVFRFLWDGVSASYDATLTPGIDEARGLAYDGAGTIYIANNGTANGAPGAALVRMTPAGVLSNPLPVAAASLDDVEYFNGELVIADAASNSLWRYSTSGALLGSVTVGASALTSPTSCMRALLSNELLVGAGLTTTGVHKFDVGYVGVTFVPWSFWTVGAAAELSTGQYLLTGPSGLARVNPNTGGFAFLTTPGGVQPELFASFDPAAVCSSAAATYCTAGTTSNGCLPSIGASGSASATALGGFTLSVTQLEGQKQGLIFYGVSGRSALPWGTGPSLLCVKTPTQRMSLGSSGGTNGACDGVLSEDWNAFMTANPAALGSPRYAGQVVQAQGWFRDPPAPKTTNLSNGLEFVVCP